MIVTDILIDHQLSIASITVDPIPNSSLLLKALKQKIENEINNVASVISDFEGDQTLPNIARCLNLTPKTTTMSIKNWRRHFKYAFSGYADPNIRRLAKLQLEAFQRLNSDLFSDAKIKASTLDYDKKPSILDVSVSDSFEMGKLMGKQDILNELKELSIVDPTFQTYIKARLNSLEDTSEIIKKYNILNKTEQ
jgi:hypothetical protein